MRPGEVERDHADDEPLASYVRACDLGEAGPDRTASEFGMLAGMIEEPRVLEATRERQAGWMQRMLAGAADPVDAWLVRLAADGLWYSDLLGVAPPEGGDRRRLIARLLALAAGDAR